MTADCHGNPIQVIDLPVVLLQVTELSEVLLAEGAGVGFHACVDAHVLSQVAGVGERLGAVGTLVGLGLCVVAEGGRSMEKGGIHGRERATPGQSPRVWFCD